MGMEKVSKKAQADSGKDRPRGAFSRYKKEQMEILRDAEINRPSLDKKIGILRKINDETEWGDSCYAKDHIKQGMAALYPSRLYLSSDEVKCLSAELPDINTNEFGYCLILGSLMEGSPDESFVLLLPEHFTPDCLCAANSKNVTVVGTGGEGLGWEMRGGAVIVEGDVLIGACTGMIGGSVTIRGNAGDELGIGMEGGRILIQGDAGNDVGGAMYGGRIEIMGNAGDFVGSGNYYWEKHDERNGMRAGNIIIRGDAGSHLGEGMRGGQIHVDGEIVGMGDVVGGRIYHKGKLIVEK
jgi:formylmethanofuran dehydrogenase subunit C